MKIIFFIFFIFFFIQLLSNRYVLGEKSNNIDNTKDDKLSPLKQILQKQRKQAENEKNLIKNLAEIIYTVKSMDQSQSETGDVYIDLFLEDTDGKNTTKMAESIYSLIDTLERFDIEKRQLRLEKKQRKHKQSKTQQQQLDLVNDKFISKKLLSIDIENFDFERNVDNNQQQQDFDIIDQEIIDGLPITHYKDVYLRNKLISKSVNTDSQSSNSENNESSSVGLSIGSTSSPNSSQKPSLESSSTNSKPLEPPSQESQGSSENSSSIDLSSQESYSNEQSSIESFSPSSSSKESSQEYSSSEPSPSSGPSSSSSLSSQEYSAGSSSVSLSSVGSHSQESSVGSSLVGSSSVGSQESLVGSSSVGSQESLVGSSSVGLPSQGSSSIDSSSQESSSIGSVGSTSQESSVGSSSQESSVSSFSVGSPSQGSSSIGSSSQESSSIGSSSVSSSSKGSSSQNNGLSSEQPLSDNESNSESNSSQYISENDSTSSLQNNDPNSSSQNNNSNSLQSESESSQNESNESNSLETESSSNIKSSSSQSETYQSSYESSNSFSSQSSAFVSSSSESNGRSSSSSSSSSASSSSSSPEEQSFPISSYSNDECGIEVQQIMLKKLGNNLASWSMNIINLKPLIVFEHISVYRKEAITKPDNSIGYNKVDVWNTITSNGRPEGKLFSFVYIGNLVPDNFFISCDNNTTPPTLPPTLSPIDNHFSSSQQQSSSQSSSFTPSTSSSTQTEGLKCKLSYSQRRIGYIRFGTKIKYIWWVEIANKGETSIDNQLFIKFDQNVENVNGLDKVNVDDDNNSEGSSSIGSSDSIRDSISDSDSSGSDNNIYKVGSNGIPLRPDSFYAFTYFTQSIVPAQLEFIDHDNCAEPIDSGKPSPNQQIGTPETQCSAEIHQEKLSTSLTFFGFISSYAVTIKNTSPVQSLYDLTIIFKSSIKEVNGIDPLVINTSSSTNTQISTISDSNYQLPESLRVIGIKPNQPFVFYYEKYGFFSSDIEIQNELCSPEYFYNNK